MLRNEKLEDLLTAKDLRILKNCFEDPSDIKNGEDEDDDEDDGDEIVENQRFGTNEAAKGDDKTPMSLSLKEFARHLGKCVGIPISRSDSEGISSKLQASNGNLISWIDLCGYLNDRYSNNDLSRQNHLMPLKELPVVFNISQNRRQATLKMLIARNPDRLMTFSQKGITISWNPRSLKPQRRVFLFSSPAISSGSAASTSSGHSKHRRQEGDSGSFSVSNDNVWATDVLIMDDCRKIAVASTRRDVRIYDMSAALSNAESAAEEEYIIHGLPNWTISMVYANSSTKKPSSHLLMADDKGSVHVIEFLRPTFQLFPTKHKRGNPSVKIPFEEMTPHVKHPSWNEYLNYRNMTLADESITRMQYFVDQDKLIIGSSSQFGSVTITDLHCKQKMHHFNVAKGVTCFDYDPLAKVLITGSRDRLIRVWNAYVNDRPQSVLQGHRCGVVDLKIDAGLGLFFSLSRDGVLKIWGGKECSCLHTCTLQFRKKMEISGHRGNVHKNQKNNNSNNNRANNHKNKYNSKQSVSEDSLLEFSAFPMLLDADRRQLLVTCGSELASIKIQANDGMTEHPPIEAEEGTDPSGTDEKLESHLLNLQPCLDELQQGNESDTQTELDVDGTGQEASEETKQESIQNSSETETFVDTNQDKFKYFALRSTNDLFRTGSDRVNTSVLRREKNQSCPFSALKLHSIDFKQLEAKELLIDQSLQLKTKDCFFKLADVCELKHSK